ncbi:DUF4249 domain-containing protein [Flavobacteriales bacterium]|nr:DUF4249 domain-containing protein [Flavobacteriales bacterium]
MRYYLYFLVILIFYSCQEEITLDLPQAEKRLVVEGSIENGFPPYVVLTNNQGYFEEIDSDTYNNLFINDAIVKIWIYNEDGIKEDSVMLEQLPPPFDSIPIYTDINIINNPGTEKLGEVGKTYYLEINWNNQIITANTKIPEPTKLDCLWVEQNESADEEFKCDIRAIYSDPADQQNNILIKSKRIQHYELNKEDTTLCEIKNNEDFPFKLIDAGPDVLINGESFETYFPRPKENGFPTGTYNAYHTKVCDGDTLEFEEDIVLIKFCQIDKPSLQFWRGLIRQVGTNGNPFSEPMNLVSNVNGGLGVFTGYGAYYYIVPIIKGNTIDKDTVLTIKDIF